MFFAQPLIGAIGFFVLWLRWRDARSLQNAQMIQPESLTVNDEEPAAGNG